MGLPNPETTPPATVVKVSSGTPELSAPAPQNQTPNFDPSPVATGRNVPSQQVTQNVKVIALRGDMGDATLSQRPLAYEEGDRGDLIKADKQGLKTRPLENPELAVAAPAETLEQKPRSTRSPLEMRRAMRLCGRFARSLACQRPRPFRQRRISSRERRSKIAVIGFA